MKVAKIIPMHKGDSALSVGNYRPISLLPIFSKIFERLIYNRLIDFVTENKILSELQFGFQKKTNLQNMLSPQLYLPLMKQNSIGIPLTAFF